MERINWKHLREIEQRLTAHIMGSSRTQNHSVDTSSLSVASKRILKKYGFYYLDDLAAVSPEYLYKMEPSKGAQVRAKEIKSECERLGVVIGRGLDTYGKPHVVTEGEKG